MSTQAMEISAGVLTYLVVPGLHLRHNQHWHAVQLQFFLSLCVARCQDSCYTLHGAKAGCTPASTPSQNVFSLPAVSLCEYSPRQQGIMRVPQ